MHHIKKAKLFRRPNILIISLYLNFWTKIRPFLSFEQPVWLKWPCISLVYPFLKKGKTFLVIKYFDHILISHFSHPNKAIFIFWYPVWLKWLCISLVDPFLKKGTPNVPYQKGKTFHEIKYFDHILVSQFLHQNNAFLIFAHPVYG